MFNYEIGSNSLYAFEFFNAVSTKKRNSRSANVLREIQRQTLTLLLYGVWFTLEKTILILNFKIFFENKNFSLLSCLRTL